MFSKQKERTADRPALLLIGNFVSCKTKNLGGTALRFFKEKEPESNPVLFPNHIFCIAFKILIPG
jgi:hypothetical protein